MIGLGSDAEVTTEQYKQIQTEVVYAAQKFMAAREIIGMDPAMVNWGTQQWAFNTVTDPNDAIMSMIIEDHQDTVNLTESTVNVPIIQKKFTIEERKLAASRINGTPLDVINVNRATYKAALLENTLLLIGNTLPTVDGLYNSAGNTEGTTNDFGTYGKAIAEMKLALAVMDTDNIYEPYNMVLHPTQYNELVLSQSSTGIRELPVVVESLGGGRVIKEPSMTAGTGMLLSADGPAKGYFKGKIARDLTVDIVVNPVAKGGGIEGIVYEAIFPVIYEANSICTLTGI